MGRYFDTTPNFGGLLAGFLAGKALKGVGKSFLNARALNKYADRLGVDSDVGMLFGADPRQQYAAINAQLKQQNLNRQANDLWNTLGGTGVTLPAFSDPTNKNNYAKNVLFPLLKGRGEYRQEVEEGQPVQEWFNNYFQPQQPPINTSFNDIAVPRDPVSTPAGNFEFDPEPQSTTIVSGGATAIDPLFDPAKPLTLKQMKTILDQKNEGERLGISNRAEERKRTKSEKEMDRIDTQIELNNQKIEQNEVINPKIAEFYNQRNALLRARRNKLLASGSSGSEKPRRPKQLSPKQFTEVEQLRKQAKRDLNSKDPDRQLKGQRTIEYIESLTVDGQSTAAQSSGVTKVNEIVF